MAKFPSQNKLLYETGALGDDAWTAAGHLNLPKDLSILNRRGYASTTRKGVPLVYRVAFTMSQHTITGRASARDASDVGTASEENTTETANAADNTTLLKVMSCQNNWVMKNAAVKFHAARENMFRQAGINKKDRGAYAHEIRYNFDSASQSWLTPYDGDGAAFVGGTWDVSKLSMDDDADIQLKLVGSGEDESTDWSASALQIGFSYLSSRGQVPDDSNVETSTSPTSRSALIQLLSSVGPELSTTDDIRTTSQGEQDNPPYDQWAANDVNMDITEPVEAGRVICGPGSAVGSVICDIPFGLAKLEARHAGSQNQTIVDPVAVTVEILGIYPMQG